MGVAEWRVNRGGFSGEPEHTLANPALYTNYAFGYSVSISGNHVIIGAPYEMDENRDEQGRAYVFDVRTGLLVHALDNPGNKESWFGYSVSVAGGNAIVGASRQQEGGSYQSGRAYIYNAQTGTLLHTLSNPNAYGSALYDTFGCAVAIYGPYAIVGAVAEDDTGGSSSGKAYIFDVATGALVHTLDNPNAYGTSAADNFGFSVAISDNHAIVGAYKEDDVGVSESGKAYIYDVSTGALLHTLDNPNAYGTSAADYFGYSVSISDRYAIVGAYLEDDTGGSSSGKAYIYDVATGVLLHTLDNPNAYGTSTSDYFGYSVSISDRYAIVGAYGEDDAIRTDIGAVYVFNASTGALLYTLQGALISSSSGLGGSVSISGTHVITGATARSKAYIYDLDPKTLIRLQ